MNKTTAQTNFAARVLTVIDRVLSSEPEIPQPVEVRPSEAHYGNRWGHQESSLSTFDEKFSKYLQGYWSNGVFYTDQPLPVTIEVFAHIVERCGGYAKIFPPEEVKKMRQCEAKAKNLDLQLSEHSFLNITSKFLGQMSGMDAHLLDGKTPPRVATKQEVEASYVETRKRIHQLRLDLGREIYVILAPVCIRVRDAARGVVEEMEAAERSQSIMMGIEFGPSRLLQTFTYFAVRIAMAPVANYLHGSGFIMPECDPHKVWRGFLTLPEDTQAIPLFGSHVSVPLQKEIESSADRQLREEAHAKKLAELNKIHDEIRNQPPK